MEVSAIAEQLLKDPLKISIFCSDGHSAKDYLRTVLPLGSLGMMGFVDIRRFSWDNLVEDPQVVNILLPSDVIVIMANSDPRMARFLDQCRAMGKAVVVDIDDDLFNVNPSNPAYVDLGMEEVYMTDPTTGERRPVWVEGQDMGDKVFSIEKNRRNQDIIASVLQKATIVTTTTDRFARYLRSYNENVFTLPNSLDLGMWKAGRMPRPGYRIGFQGGDCADDQTEILTDSGWKFFKDLDKTEKVVTLNRQTGQIEYQMPTAWVDKPYSGPMHKIDTPSVNYSFTPNHNMYLSDIGGGEFKIVKASAMSGKYHLKRNGIWSGAERPTFTIPGTGITAGMDDWLTFFGFWLAEGWTSVGNHVGVAVNKTGSRERMCSLLSSWGFNVHHRRGDVEQLVVSNKRLHDYLSGFGKAHQKFIPADLKNLSSRQLNILLKSYRDGDGHGRRADTTSRMLANDLQEISLKCGISATIKNRGKRSGGINKRGLKIEARHDCFTVTFSQPISFRHPNVDTNQQKIEHYDGRIYCVDVPNHIIYTRRCGKPMWVGNSHVLDLRMAAPAILQFMKNHADVRFVACGWLPQPFIDELQAADLWNRVEFVMWQGVEAYPWMMMTMGLDHGIAPLLDEKFNHMKSVLKWEEYGAMGVACSASKVPPYSDEILHGHDGWLVEPDGWLKNLEYVYANKDDRLRVGANARKRMEEEFSVTKIAPKYLGACLRARQLAKETESEPDSIIPTLGSNINDEEV